MDMNSKKYYERVREKDPQYVGHIILNLTDCDFCIAMGIDNCKGKRTTCKEYIDNFLRNYGKNNDISHQSKTFTEEEQALIDGVELARDWQLPIPPEDYAKYLELTENRDVGEK